MISQMHNRTPFEVQKGCRFLMFDFGNEVRAMQYMAVRRIIWKETKSSEQESLEFQFDDCLMRVQGAGLKRLLPLLQNDEVFIIRSGSVNGERSIQITEIDFEELEPVA